MILIIQIIYCTRVFGQAQEEKVQHKLVLARRRAALEGGHNNSTFDLDLSAAEL
jgi:hypothetical protein